MAEVDRGAAEAAVEVFAGGVVFARGEEAAAGVDAGLTVGEDGDAHGAGGGGGGDGCVACARDGEDVDVDNGAGEVCEVLLAGEGVGGEISEVNVCDASLCGREDLRGQAQSELVARAGGGERGR